MFGWDFEVDAWSRSWRCNLIKIFVWTCDMNSTLGSFVPLAMFVFRSRLAGCTGLPIISPSRTQICVRFQPTSISTGCSSLPIIYLSLRFLSDLVAQMCVLVQLYLALPNPLSLSPLAAPRFAWDPAWPGSDLRQAQGEYLGVCVLRTWICIAKDCLLTG